METKELEERIDNILKQNVEKIVISNVAKSNCLYRKIDILNKVDHFMIAKYTDKQAFTENLLPCNMKGFLLKQAENFKQFNFFTDKNEIMIKISNRGKILFCKKQIESSRNMGSTNNNREKKYIFEEGKKIEPLIDMGVLTKDGKVVKSMFDKFKQINRFIEIIDDEVKDQNYKSLNIIDFGCGKSYLTFVVYYYFKFIKKIDVHMTGLDLKEEVIKKCNETAQKYGYEHLKFELGDINGYTPNEPVDMVITLHACDTATDYALFNAINWKVKMIFSVPCCQHEINSQVSTDVLPIMLKYGIIKERLSAQMTDVIRCNLLKSVGYNVDLMEFVDFAHTPKNLIIRAKRSSIPEKIKAQQIDEINELLKVFPCKQTLFELLKGNKLI